MIQSRHRQTHLCALLMLCASMLLPLVGNAPPVAAQQEPQVTQMSTYTAPAPIKNVVVVGDRTYLTYFNRQNNEYRSGLQILDTRDPASPIVLGDYSLVPHLPFELIVTETAAIISFATVGVEPEENQSSRGVLFLDIQDATAPKLLSTYPTTAIGSLAVVGNRLYVVDSSSPFITAGSGRTQLQIINVDDLTAPVLMGAYTMPNDAIESVAAQDDLVYLGKTRTGLLVLDVSDPATPLPIGSWGPAGVPPIRLVVEGDRLYFADHRFRILDISDPNHPRSLGGGSADGTHVQVQDGIAYLLGGWRDSLHIVDARAHWNPRSLVRYGEDIDLAVPAGDLVYLVTDGELQIVRVTGIPSEAPTARCFEEVITCIDDGRIRDYWEQNGGLSVFGLPLGKQRPLTIEGRRIDVQWFERNRLELHPENAPPYDVLLGRLGVIVLAKQGRDWQTFPTADAPQPGCRYFAETQQNVCGDILTAWRANGLDLGDPGISERESLALFGLPISPLQEEEIAGETREVQWFERARFERHPENAPPFDVLLGLLGREAAS